MAACSQGCAGGYLAKVPRSCERIGMPDDAQRHAGDARATSLLRRIYCVLSGGHYRVLRFQREDGVIVRVCQRCVACNSETPGWWLRGAR